MRVALCLHGYFGTVSTGDNSTVIGGLKHIDERIFSKCENIDVFVHCWQPEHKSVIEDFYAPKKSKFEEQIDFDKECVKNKIDQSYIDDGFPRSKTMYKNATASRILSFYYSRSEAIKLKKSYEKENNFTYDWVITTRFDIGQRGGSEVNQIRFDPSSESNYLYTTDWDQKNCGYGDMWFYGSSKIMDLYSTIYESALKDFKADSEYERCFTSGWFDSNFFDIFDVRDCRQFTNELDKSKELRSKSLMKYPRWYMSNSHTHHKWFCKETGLYEKTRWV